MASQSDAGFFPASPGRAASSPNIFRGLQRSTSKVLGSPLPKPIITSTNKTNTSAVATPSSPSSPSKPKLRGDRYIPDRSSTCFSVSQFALTQPDSGPSERLPSVESYKRSLANSMFEPEVVDVLVGSAEHNPSQTSSDTASSLPPDSILYVKGSMSTGRLNSPKSPSKMLSFSPRTSHAASTRVLPAVVESPRRKTRVRVIPTSPERVLDAPGLIDDYYLNLLDWSSTNLVAVALGHAVYVWNATTGVANRLFWLQGLHSYVASISFSGNGQYLAVGTDDQLVHIWDVQASRRVRTLKGHLGRVGALSWSDHLLSSGARDSLILTHDVRLAESKICTMEGHLNEVCGLKWSPDGTQLASGSNDNFLNIWNISYTTPLHKFEEHHAAVKAIAWCPWQRHLLASGGGTADKTIKLWNTSSGTCLNSIDTSSQVCSLQWSKHVKELVSSHGFSQNQLAVWKYPSMKKQADLTGHNNRVLHTAMSPDGTTIVSAAADETLRFWRIFDLQSSSKLPRSHSDANLRRKILR